METINKPELRDENIYPAEDVIKKVLGRSFNAYNELLNLFNENGLVYEWRYYRDGKAWLCKVQFKKRTIVWMSAWKGFMQATVYVPEKYLEDVFKIDISESAKEKIANTKNVGKSKPCTFHVRNKSVLKDFEKIMKFKMVNK